VNKNTTKTTKNARGGDHAVVTLGAFCVLVKPGQKENEGEVVQVASNPIAPIVARSATFVPLGKKLRRRCAVLQPGDLLAVPITSEDGKTLLGHAEVEVHRVAHPRCVVDLIEVDPRRPHATDDDLLTSAPTHYLYPAPAPGSSGSQGDPTPESTAKPKEKS